MGHSSAAGFSDMEDVLAFKNDRSAVPVARRHLLEREAQWLRFALSVICALALHMQLHCISFQVLAT